MISSSPLRAVFVILIASLLLLSPGVTTASRGLNYGDYNVLRIEPRQSFLSRFRLLGRQSSSYSQKNRPKQNKQKKRGIVSSSKKGLNHGDYGYYYRSMDPKQQKIFLFRRDRQSLSPHKVKKKLKQRPHDSLFFRERKKVHNPQRKQQRQLTRLLQKWISGNATPGPIVVHHVLYWVTALDALQFVVWNDYYQPTSRISKRRTTSTTTPLWEYLIWSLVPQPWLSSSSTPTAASQQQQQQHNHHQPYKVQSAIYARLFYFARLRPRLLFSVGALLRGLQLCTPLRLILDPSIGVGAGVNVCAMIATSRWVKPLLLGWTATKYAWTWLGAKPMERAYVPISLSLNKQQSPQPQPPPGGS